ncbi:16S rRNA (guanine(527)-N(7))-methyltransferase RsmG [Siculibacillus lacustris]|uniref:16S rRNA (guanine(527)-N(7))-methyltransferase RsmG n=1 Tax=Siculibacillus lacustris TaxID=1549641 RepID=UPI001D197820|nr:16S rRNA (guanine(527)-N(7))-methyltransferase RsmG [Siculibacillus lacustris]
MTTDDLRCVSDIYPVSRETAERLTIYVDLVVKWQKSQNLVAPGTLPQIWRRHVADSVQVAAIRPEATRWLDLGSGAGFPGLVTAIVNADRPGAVVHLVESNHGKAAFLRTVARETGVAAIVHTVRIEEFVADFAEPIEAISARALAPLVRLIPMVAPLVGRGAVAVFHKGQDFASELADATASWDLNLVEHPSRIEPGSRLVEIRGIAPRAPT